MPSRQVELSIIVPVHGRAEHLAAALAPLDAQLGDHDELIVVDNGVADPRVLPSADGDRVRVVSARSRPGAGAARNRGAAVARGRLLLFCDADDVAADGYVEAMRRALDDADVVGALEDTRALSELAPGDEGRSGPLHHWGGDRRWPFVGAGAMGITADAFVRLGGFDEAIPALEDIDLCFAAALQGCRFVGVDDAVMQVRNRSTTREEFRRMRVQGRASTWLHARFDGDGLPPDRPLRQLVGWGVHVLGLVAAVVRRDRWGRAFRIATIGWKIGQLQARRDRPIPPRHAG